MDPAVLDAAVDAAREELVALCADLVAARSVTPPGDTRAAAAVVRAFLQGAGLAVEEAPASAVHDNLVVRTAGAVPGRHLVLNGHLDTMESGDESAWSVPPLALTRRDGRLYGLGMGNMKGGVAALCLATAVLARHAADRAGAVTLTVVSDEVVFGEHGSAHLLATRPDLVGDGLLSAEGPGWMRLAVAEKGTAWIRLTATGKGGHASAVQVGRSAVTRLAAAVTAVDALNGRTAALPSELAGLGLDPEDQGVRLTANVGTIAGGTVPNQIARSATAEVDLRLPPGLDLAAAEAAVAEAAGVAPGVTWERMKGWDPNWTAGDDPLVAAVAQAAAAVRGAAPDFAVRLPGSDASRWRARGVAAVCYGPQPTFSAGVDDHAVEQDVVDCAKVYARAALAFCGGGA